MIIKSEINEVVDGAISSVNLYVENDEEIVQSLSFLVTDEGATIVIDKSKIYDVDLVEKSSLAIMDYLIKMDVQRVAVKSRDTLNKAIVLPITSIVSVIENIEKCSNGEHHGNS